MKPISLYEFGSSEQVVRQIQQPFVDLFRGQSPVLDIGCGRGIFLELLAKADIDAVGVDQSEEAVSACRAKGFSVDCEDGRAYLNRTVGRFGGIFCSHVIEHMSYQDAMTFLQLCYGALRPSGVLLLVTPNPEDLTIISEIFWLDPSHIRPYPLLLLKSMLDAIGFHVIRESQFLGSWRLVGKRRLPGYLFRRILLGRHFGRPNTLVLAKKNGCSN